ncbi:hypothetical protein I6N95_26665 [Vagococcus sp. BWB3-3]|uniref:Uncharacterized protein n=1 Tax=Vagococcus allomyrinae TaxID=2794353 RepID=A0A940PIK0_9ENTE|nr:hypothetical protein [Vagococcus allomyrinae]MBP1044598.1 hypothetical protein [Vagococcus allomyrinae]
MDRAEVLTSKIRQKEEQIRDVEFGIRKLEKELLELYQAAEHEEKVNAIFFSMKESKARQFSNLKNNVEGIKFSVSLSENMMDLVNGNLAQQTEESIKHAIRVIELKISQTEQEIIRLKTTQNGYEIVLSNLYSQRRQL